MSNSKVATPPVVLNPHYLKETTLRGKEDITIAGVIQADTLANIGFDSYQRDLGTMKQREKLYAALKDGKPLPPVELGMRGARTRDHKDGSIHLNDPVYAIDGRQRIGTMIEWLQNHPKDTHLYLPATVYLNTERKWEQERFIEVNLGQRRVSPNKILAELREKGNPGILTLYGLSNNERNFPMCGRVSWEQNMKRADLISARSFLMVAGHLHSHLVHSRGYSIRPMVTAMDQISKTFGVQNLRENMRTFFNVVEDAWGVRDVPYRQGMKQLHNGFLMSLARLFSDHHDFWTDNNKVLEVTAADRKRLRGFVLDNNVVRLVEGGTQSRLQLRNLMVSVMNRHRKGKLKERTVMAADLEDTDINLADVG